MDETKKLGDAVASSGAAIMDAVVTYLPSILGAVLLLLAGWILARLLRAVTVRSVLLLDTLLSRVTKTAGVERLRMARSSTVLGAVVFWVVLLFFVTAATHVLGLQSFTEWLARLLDYLPTLAAGLLIVIVGYVFSRFLADLVQATATRLAPAQRNALARVAQGMVLITAVLVGADQIGIQVTFLAILVGTMVAAAVGGVTIAVSLGARDYVSNLIGAHYMRQAFDVGQRVRARGHEGRILEITVTSLVLETDEGRVAVPARVYHEEPIVLIARSSNG
ncbi:MAG: mechanosensitive ion channel [Betaproteobacteria bacterium]|nr:mechanosensitive ion channel [Betaproteobacteria bacterium]